MLDQSDNIIMNVHMARNEQTPKQTKRLSKSKSQKKQCAPKETPEQKADREQKRAQFAALQLAKYGDPLAAIRAANPKKDIGEGSPYQAAREAWVNTRSSDVFDHWTSQKD